MSLKDFLKDIDYAVPAIIGIIFYIVNKDTQAAYMYGFTTAAVLSSIILYFIRRL